MDPIGLENLKVHHLEPKYYGFIRLEETDAASYKARLAVHENMKVDILTGPYYTDDWGLLRAAIQTRVNAETLDSPYVFFRAS
jgi:hypothetical protein